jgi:hypothetical protein
MSFPGVDLGRFPGVLVLEARGDPGIQNKVSVRLYPHSPVSSPGGAKSSGDSPRRRDPYIVVLIISSAPCHSGATAGIQSRFAPPSLIPAPPLSSRSGPPGRGEPWPRKSNRLPRVPSFFASTNILPPCSHPRHPERTSGIHLHHFGPCPPRMSFPGVKTRESRITCFVSHKCPMWRSAACQ